jgi:DNA (cytosine-5)-methyltransferase 1
LSRRPPVLRLALDDDEICVDYFAGGGGASTGMDEVLAKAGRHVNIAINHDAEAIAMHKANHPKAEHYVEDVFDIDIVKAVAGRRIGFAWYSPDCTFHSKARGGKPFRDRNKARRTRGLAWVIHKHVKQLGKLAPRIVAMENVQEFADWGPLDDQGKIIQIKRGQTFRKWCRQLQNLGYELDMWELQGCDYGAPTTRERLFIVGRRDGLPIVKPEATHGPGLKPYRTAAECINWQLPCPSIFERKKPLAENTLRRIAEGIRRFVINSADPFIVPVSHAGDSRVHDSNEPLRTITASRRGDFAIAQPVIVGVGGRRGQSAPLPVTRPYPTITAKGDAAIITPFVTKFRQNSVGTPLNEPLHTITSGGDMERPAGAAHAMGLVTPLLVGIDNKSNGARDAWNPEDPLRTITTENRFAAVAPVLVPRYGERPGQAPRARSPQLPLPTIVTTDNGAQVVTAYLAKQNGVGEKIVLGQDVRGPTHTITTKDQKAVVTSHLLKFRQHSAGQDMREPMHTITTGGGSSAGHFAEVRALLIKYYSEGGQWGSLKQPLDTITTKDRLGLVTVTIKGEEYAIVDIGLRMLTPRELYRAQGFPENYKIEKGVLVAGRRKNPGRELRSRKTMRFTKTAQVRMCGNSVCPPVAAAIMEAQLRVDVAQEEAA